MAKLLQESGSILLLEDGFAILLDEAAQQAPPDIDGVCTINRTVASTSQINRSIASAAAIDRKVDSVSSINRSINGTSTINRTITDDSSLTGN